MIEETRIASQKYKKKLKEERDPNIKKTLLKAI